MARDTDHHHYVRRVVLPSGKTIEVVYFDDQVVHSEAVASAPAAAAEPATREELHICGSCASDLVYPTEWSEAGSRHWEVSLRCPNCEWHGTGVFEQDVVERFDATLDRGTEAVVADLRRLLKANMEGEIERFVSALDADMILPEDF